MYNELKYIEEVEENYLQNPIDYLNFDQNEFDNTLKCKYCNCEFDHPHNDRCIILNEIVDKEKLKYILVNNDYNEEVNNLAKIIMILWMIWVGKEFNINKNINVKIDIMELGVVYHI